ncbi:MAG: ABC transporter ATP-binding protein [Eubacteriales bacterium]
MANAIEINKLTKYYGKSRGIIDVTFNVEEGEIFGFIGPNGAGKSTTIRTILSLIYPSSGEANIFGLDCIKQAPEIAKRVGYLPSEVFYYDGMKVKDLLNYSASFYKKDCKKRIQELAELMNLDLNKKIDDLSYGNKKKVGIVQGLLHSPDLIILDEPTSGLDPLMQQTFFDLLEAENKRGATVLMSSHILGEVQRLCNRVAIIKDGTIIKLEKISTLQDESYKRIKFETSDSIPQDYFTVSGVNNFKTEGKTNSFIFKGDINVMTAKLSALKLTNLWVDEPDLEEIFMHYYSKEA